MLLTFLSIFKLRTTAIGLAQIHIDCLHTTDMKLFVLNLTKNIFQQIIKQAVVAECSM